MNTMRSVRGGWRASAAYALACAIVGATAVGASPGAVRPESEPSHTPRARTSASFGSLPVAFEPNVGQADSDVTFLAGGRAALTANGAVLVGGSEPVALRFDGASPSARAAGERELPGKANYLRGDDPSRWHTGIPTFAAVRYEQVYPGVDLVWYGKGRSLEYDLVVAPGADPGAVSFTLDGAPAPRIDDGGALVAGDLRLERPVAYQEIDGARRPVASRYALLGDGRIGFRLGEYDHRVPLVVDPEIVYTYDFAESGKEIGVNGVAVDASGSAYVVGATRTGSAPRDILLAKLNPAGTALVYSTTIGGSNTDQAFDVAVDAQGNAYLTGETLSTNFPTTAGAFQTTFGGGNSRPDAIVVKVGPSGDAVVYSTYLGGNEFDNGRDIVVDEDGNAYVVGTTASANFPTTSPSQATFGGSTDAFVTKVNATGSARVYSTYLGGSGGENGEGIALDAGGNVYIAGLTGSSNFPTSAGALQTTFGGGVFDGIWAKYDASGQRVASTYLGGSGEELARAVAVDADGNSHLTGETNSANFPLVAPLQSSITGTAHDAFVATLNAGGSALAFSTFYGGSQYETGNSIGVDAGGLVTVAGETYSSDFPTVDPLQPAFGGGLSDAFVLQIGAGAARRGEPVPRIVFASNLGGPRAEFGLDSAVDPTGAIYVGSFLPNLSGSNAEMEEGQVTKVVPATEPRPDLKVLVAAIDFLSVQGVPSAIIQVIVRSTDECGGQRVPNATFSLEVPIGLGVTGAAPGAAGVRVVSAPPAGQPGVVVFQIDRQVEDDGTDRGTVQVALPESGMSLGPVLVEAFASTSGATECNFANNTASGVIDVGKRVFMQGARLLELNTKVDASAPPAIQLVNNAAPAAAQRIGAGRRGTVRGFNVYTSTQPNVQAVPANLLTSIPPTQSSVDVSTTPTGSFFVVTTVSDAGESDPSNEVGGELPTVTKLKVSASKVVAQGTGFASDVEVFFGGLPFTPAPKLKRGNTKVVQKGPLITGQSIGEFTSQLLGPGSKVVVLFVNGNGNAVAVEYTR